MEKIELLSLLVAICALILTLHQITATRRHNRLSVTPHIRFGWTAGTSGDGIWFKNEGLGPALITNFTILKNDKSISLKELQDSLKKKGMDVRINIPTSGSTLLDRDFRLLIESKDILICKEEQEMFWGEVSGIKFSLEYESFYGITEPKIDWTSPNPIDGLVTAKPPRKRAKFNFLT